MGIIGYHLRAGDVYLIFDRYLHGSTKQVTRSNRAGKDASRKHQLNLHTPLPAQKVILNVSYNKAQLIKLICQYLMDHEVSDTNRLVVTSENPIPNEKIVANRAPTRFGINI